MSTVQEIEAAIAALPIDQYAQLKQWLASFDPDAFDRQIENDAKAGKLDRLAQEALKAHQRGESRPL